MNRRRTTLGVAAVGVVAGAVGIGFLAAPAGAGQSPVLPSITAQALVQSVVTANPPAMAGTVEIHNNLGLPAVPGLPAQLAGGSSQIRVWTDGVDHSRISLPSTTSDETIVDDGTTIYDYDSATHTVTEHHINKATARTPAMPDLTKPGKDNEALDPATLAKGLIAAVQQNSTISVDGTDVVASRPAYDLVLTPKPSQRTLLRQIRIAIDAQTRMPLQLTVLADNTDTPALQVGFTSMDIGAQDPSLFHFTVPAGVNVVNGDKDAQQSMQQVAGQVAPKFVGTGWETVVVLHLPDSPTNQTPDQSTAPDKSGFGRGSSSRSDNPMNLLQQFGKPVSGAWGNGWVLSTDVGNALITSDGRVAAGFVPQQLPISALGK